MNLDYFMTEDGTVKIALGQNDETMNNSGCPVLDHLF